MCHLLLSNQEKAYDTFIIKASKMAQIFKETFMQVLLKTGWISRCHMRETMRLFVFNSSWFFSLSTLRENVTKNYGLCCDG